MKEKGMHDKAALRYEEGLKAIKKGIMSKSEPKSATR